jgi:hypothetical protein
MALILTVIMLVSEHGLFGSCASDDEYSALLQAQTKNHLVDDEITNSSGPSTKVGVACEKSECRAGDWFSTCPAGKTCGKGGCYDCRTGYHRCPRDSGFYSKACPNDKQCHRTGCVSRSNQATYLGKQDMCCEEAPAPAAPENDDGTNDEGGTDTVAQKPTRELCDRQCSSSQNTCFGNCMYGDTFKPVKMCPCPKLSKRDQCGKQCDSTRNWCWGNCMYGDTYKEPAPGAMCPC